MKLSRIVATGAAFSLVAASVLLGSSAANAADYYETDGANFPVEASTYINDWFKGTVTNSPGSYANVAGGLEMTGGAQLLNGGTPVTGLETLVDNASFVLASGTATFQISMFTTPNQTPKGFTTLRPVVADTVPNSAAASMWQVSQGFGTITANTPYSITQLRGQMDADYQILAYGVFVDPGTTTVIESITWNGDTHFFFAEPDPFTTTVSPSSLTVSELASTGVAFDISGLPGVEVLVCSIEPAAGGDAFGEQEVNMGQGTASYEFIGTAAVGEYVITCVDFANPDLNFSGSFTVTAELAATGPADVTPFVLGGALLLLLGAGVTVFAVRRKQALSA